MVSLDLGAILVLLCVIIFYLGGLGGVVVLESKVLGSVQLSSSVSRMGFFGSYHSLLDFLKMVLKGVLGFSMWSVCGVVLVFLFYVSLGFGFMLILPVTYFGLWIGGCWMVILFLDLSWGVLKIFLSYSHNFKFVQFSSNKMKEVYILSSSLVVFVYFMVFIIIGEVFGVLYFGGVDFSYSSQKKFLESGVFLVVLFVLVSSLVMLKSFKTPFDYLEVESEFVGGLSLELFGVSFGIWSLLEYISVYNGLLYSCILVWYFFVGKGVLVGGFSMLPCSVVLGLIFIFYVSGVLGSASFVSLWVVYVSLYFSLLSFGCLIFYFCFYFLFL